MGKTFARTALALAACFMVAEAQAATVTYHHNLAGPTGPSSRRLTTTPESTGANAAPTEGNVVQMNLTTDADILSIGNVLLTSSNPAYQNPLGSNAEPPNPDIVAAFPSAGVDSFISTPGATSILGVPFPGDGSLNSGWGDTSDDGPQTNFLFAQFTFPKGTVWTFTGNVTVAGATGPESFPFTFAPEPGSCGMAGLAMMAVASLRRRRA